MTPLALCVGAFFLGAIPFGFLAGKLYRRDLLQEGSRNIGATNTVRVLGKGPGLTVLVLDVLKGYLPALVAQRLGMLPWWVVAISLCGVLGHIYSPFVRFKGGKGVATGLGVLIGLFPPGAGAALLAFGVVFAATRIVSISSIIGTLSQTVAFWIWCHELPYQLLSTAITLFILVRHRANLERLRRGEEKPLSLKKEG